MHYSQLHCCTPSTSTELYPQGLVADRRLRSPRFWRLQLEARGSSRRRAVALHQAAATSQPHAGPNISSELDVIHAFALQLGRPALVVVDRVLVERVDDRVLFDTRMTSALKT